MQTLSCIIVRHSNTLFLLFLLLMFDYFQSETKVSCFFYGRYPDPKVFFWHIFLVNWQHLLWMVAWLWKSNQPKSLIRLIKERSDETAWMRDQSITFEDFFEKICYLGSHSQTFCLFSKYLPLSLCRLWRIPPKNLPVNVIQHLNSFTYLFSQDFP